MAVIKPTVGRVVWFYKHSSLSTPLAGIIAYVHSDEMVNLGYLDSNGTNESATSVRLVQDGEPRPDAGWFCTWMPYQLGQAAKTEQALATAAASADAVVVGLTAQPPA